MKSKLLRAFAVAFAVALTSLAASTQVDTSPGVGRISLIHGEVSTQRGDSGDWAAAALNQPIVSGDKISTGDSSRAEVQLDYANILRLSERTQANIANLTRTQVQIQVSRGLVDLTVFRDTEADVQLDMPNVSIHPYQKDGVYRIEVLSDEETRIVVRKGEAEVSTPQGRTHLAKGQVINVRGTGSDTQYRIAEAPSKDGWDSWNSERDSLIRNARAWSNTNRYYVGSEDLDAYGRWVTVPDYGPVWSPYVSVGWAPYRAGRWVWQPYWGWTWVSYEPWGWAPYHYGRWFLYDGAWVWWPGPVYVHRYYRPIWAPAYVSFFGFGRGGFGFGFGFGSVGWLPIGPCDRFYPWWGHYRSHFNVVNVTNITNVMNITNVNLHHNRRYDGYAPLHAGDRFSNLRLLNSDGRIRNALSTVPADRFGTGRAQIQPVNHAEFREGSVMRGNLPLLPGRESLSVTGRAANPSTLPREGRQERFFSTKPAPPPRSFEREVAEVHQAIQRDGSFRATRTVGETGNSGSARPETFGKNGGREFPGRPDAGRLPQNEGRWAEGNTPSAAPESRPARTAPANNGWRRFGSEVTEDQPRNRAAGEGRTSGPEARSEQSQRNQGNDNVPPRKGEDNWRRFSGSGSRGEPGNSRPLMNSGEPRQPTAGENRPARGEERPIEPREQAPNRNNDWRSLPSQPRSSEVDRGRQDSMGDRGTRFPSGGDAMGGQRDRFPSGGNDRRMENFPRENRGPDRDSMRGSRPPLDLNRPIVTPRESSPRPDRGAGPRGGGGGSGRSEPSRGGGDRGGSRGGSSHPSSGGDRRH